MYKLISPTLENMGEINRLLESSTSRSCENCFATLYFWKKDYGIKAVLGENAISAQYNDGHFLYPIGENRKELALEILESFRKSGKKAIFLLTSDEDKEELEKLISGAFQYTELTDEEEYCYDIDKLCTLAGKKLHGKRNHINKFIAENPDWSFEEITAHNLNECKALFNEWLKNKETEIGSESTSPAEHSADEDAINDCFDNYDKLPVEGGLVRAGGKVIAFSIGSKINNSDTFDIHFEKADASIDGAYQIINREFAKMVKKNHPEVKYLNREDDLGLEGLRKSKLSYYPDLMVKKYLAIEK